MLVEAIAATLATVHFTVPLVYHGYMKTCLDRSWNIELDAGYKPEVTVIIPTYNEAQMIEKKLENLLLQDYPRDLLRIVVVDSSDDRTADIVEDWSTNNRHMNLELIREKERRGKLHALNVALKHVSANCAIIVFTDADAFWQPGIVSNAARYLADPSIGAVTACITYMETQDRLLEKTYRSYYNTIRVGESKIHSTPVHNGPFLAVKAQLIRNVGLPTFEGSDDSAFGSFIALMGYRAIQADDLVVEEPMTEKQAFRRIRRAQHLILNFAMTKSYTKKRGLYKKSSFDEIWAAEWWLHLANPWLLTLSIILLAVSVVSHGSVIALVLLGIGSLLLVARPYRTWMLQQFYLVTAELRNLWTRDVMWAKYHSRSK
jgi:cellulose synthase/poly-beta-1,6-N-acetylglucosamine synthase-like glycosyltransferase